LDHAEPKRNRPKAPEEVKLMPKLRENGCRKDSEKDGDK